MRLRATYVSGVGVGVGGGGGAGAEAEAEAEAADDGVVLEEESMAGLRLFGGGTTAWAAVVEDKWVEEEEDKEVVRVVPVGPVGPVGPVVLLVVVLLVVVPVVAAPFALWLALLSTPRFNSLAR